MFYNIGYTVESILKDRSVSDVKIVMEDNGPHLTVTFDGVMQLVVNPEWFCLQSANAPLLLMSTNLWKMPGSPVCFRWRGRTWQNTQASRTPPAR